jgi:hypothetical protein
MYRDFRLTPNGPRISCGDFLMAHYLTFLTTEAPARCMRLLGRSPLSPVCLPMAPEPVGTIEKDCITEDQEQ